MNHSHQLPLLCLLLTTIWLTPLRAQDIAGTGSIADTAPVGSTVITSDELRSDQTTHTSVFSGNVVVTGTNFNMTCQEMTVIFTSDGKIDNIVAIGKVIITQPDRITHCGQAQYFSQDDKFVLTDEPVIKQNKNEISAPKITIYRTNQKMITEGHSVVVLPQGSDTTTSTPTPSP